jgi:hypothetical protein
VEKHNIQSQRVIIIPWRLETAKEKRKEKVRLSNLENKIFGIIIIIIVETEPYQSPAFKEE